MSGRIMHGLAILAVAATMQVTGAQAQPAKSVSVFATAPDDPAAVTAKAKGDGVTDDSAAIQAAIDTASVKPGGGIVFLPSGRYRITRTLFMWPGVRLFGVGNPAPDRGIAVEMKSALMGDARYWIENNTYGRDDIAVRYHHRFAIRIVARHHPPYLRHSQLSRSPRNQA